LSDQNAVYLHKPQINLSCPSLGRMWIIFGCSLACVIQSALNDGGRSLAIAVTALFTALLTEFFFTFKKYGAQKILDGSTAATAMILVMLLPNHTSPFHVIIASIFAVAVVKYSFGGLGSNWLNPALGGWLLIRFSWPSGFTHALGNYASVSVHSLSGSGSPAGNAVTDFLNNTVLSVTNVQLPAGYIDLLFNDAQGLITDRGLFILLIGTIVITAIGINRTWIPLVFLAVYGFLIRLAGDANGILWNGDILYGFFSGGTVAAAFILAAEPSSSAKLKGGVIFTVALSAFFSWFFRYKCMEYSGCFIAIALTNSLTPLIRVIEDKFFLSRGFKWKHLFKNIRFDESDNAGENPL